MKIIRVFPRRTAWTPTDELAFVGDPPLFRPDNLPVKISVTFSWDIKEGQRLYRAWSEYYSNVRIGGPAFGDSGNDFTPGMFLKEGVIFTSRGCIRNCPWCLVPLWEGNIRELAIIHKSWIIQDNNFLACSRDHQTLVFNMLQSQNKPVTFSGGLDARLLKKRHIEWFKNIKIKELWFACDSNSSLKYLKKAADLLTDFPINKKRCYVMIGYEETLMEAEYRLRSVYKMGFLPFSQLYQPINKIEYNQEWRDLNRFWSRPANTDQG
ncbi:MAG: hypothetical protein PHW03_05410 [Eubacteriales bacterium]|nr:hypothetical protein [Eubacteriales bacterium]